MSLLTRPRRFGLRRFLAGALLIASLPWLVGCFNPFNPRELGTGVSAPPPVPDSPVNVLRLLEWAYNNRSIAEYRELFTDDYRFAFSKLDPYGDAYLGDIWTRADELESATHLFQGGKPNEPAATSITLDLGRTLKPVPDPRPGKDDRMHKSIHASVSLTITDPNKVTLVTGFGVFYLARGDVALIPDELKQKGFGPDSTRWYIERWEDDTATNTGAGGGSAALAPPTPARAAPALDELLHLTWGGVKVAFR